MAVDVTVPGSQGRPVSDTILHGKVTKGTTGNYRAVIVESLSGSDFALHVYDVNTESRSLVSGAKAIASAGTAERLVASPGTEYRWIVIQASAFNTNWGGVGDSSVDVTSAAAQGWQLGPGDSTPTLNRIDLYNVYGDVVDSGNRFTWYGSL